MSSEATREQSLLQAVLALESEAQRKAFLNIACADSPDLRERVVQLLAAHADAELFFQEPAVSHAGLADGSSVGRSAPPRQAENAAGERVGRYRLLEKIGEGGCGVVYVAEQQEPVRRRVALKVIKLGMDTRSVVARFEAERQALALMDHPNIAKVFDAGATDTGRPYFVMELVRGLKITDYCDQHQIWTTERLDLFVQVCRAVQHAHQKGIIHRDLKPSNILVTVNDGVAVPKVIDFGIAKATEGRLTDKTVYTELHQFIGTPAYMSPEQAELTSEDIDTRSDIYSLGVLLYELLTGKTPFDHQELVKVGLDAMRQIIRTKEPPRPSTRLSTLAAAEVSALARARRSDPPKLIHSVRGDLDWIVMKCLEKDRARRYETANGLARDLERHLNNEPVVARPASKLYRLQKLLRRNQFAVAAVGAVVAVSMLGTIASTVEALRAKRAEAQQSRLRALAQSEAQRAQSAVTARTKALETAYFAETQRKVRAGDPSAAVAYVSHVLSLEPTNRAALAYLMTLLTYHSWMVPTLTFKHDARITTADFSPDGRRIVTAAEDGSVHLWDAATGEPVIKPIRLGGKVIARFTSDGKGVLIVSTKGTARIWDVQTGVPTSPQIELEIEGDAVARFSPDGKYVVIAFFNGDCARVWNVLTGAPETPPLKHENHVTYAEFSPDGNRVATSSWDMTSRVWDAHTGELLTAFRQHVCWTYRAHFSPDGRRIVTASCDGTARVWDAQTGRQLIKIEAPIIYEACFSPDGKMIATCGFDNTARLWDAQTGAAIGQPMTHGKRVVSVQFSPDGDRLVTASDDCTARIWDAHSGLPLTVPLQHGPQVLTFGAQFSRDGQRVMTMGTDHIAHVWDVPIHAALPLRFGDGLALVISAQFSPDGTRIVTSSDDGSAQVWDARSGQPLSPRLVHTPVGMAVYDAEFSRDGKRVVTAGWDKTARVWDAQTGRQEVGPLQHQDRLYTARFSPDGRRILTSSWDHTARIWDARTGRQLIVVHHQDQVQRAQFSPDGKCFVTASRDHTARVWDAQTGQPVTPALHHGSSVEFADFSPDGNRVVTASGDDTARVWDAATGQPLTPPLEHHHFVLAAEFSPDGKRIVTGSADGTARLWDARTGAALTEPLLQDWTVDSAQFSPDGGTIVTHCGSTLYNVLVPFSPDGARVLSPPTTAQLWDVQTGLPMTQPLQSPPGDRWAREWDLDFKALGQLPDWVLPLAEAICGDRINQRGALEPTDLDRGKTLAAIRKRLEIEPDSASRARWGRWLLGAPAHRTLSPASSVLTSAYLENDIKDRADDSLRLPPPVLRSKYPTLQSLAETEEMAFGNTELLKRVIQTRVALAEVGFLVTNADLHARAGKWTNAIAEYSRLIEKDPGERWYYHYLALLLAQTGDTAAYQRCASNALARFGATSNPFISYLISVACLVLPGEGIDLGTACRLADVGVVRGESQKELPYFEFVKGLAEYRQGHFAAANIWMDKALAEPGVEERDAAAGSVQAMAWYRSGKIREAREALGKAAQIVHTRLPRLESGDLGGGWNDWITAQLLFREAESLVSSSTPRGP